MGNLRSKYCIVGVGETEYSRGSGRTTRAMAVEAIRKAMDDAGVSSQQVDGIMSYHGGDSDPGYLGDVRPGHPAKLLHGLLRRWFQHRGAGGTRHGSY